jgi:type III secretion protein J
MRALGIAALIVAGVSGCKEEAFRNLSSRDANEMYAILANNGISATREIQTDGTGKLLITSSELPRAIQILSAQGYPREAYKSMADVFPGDGLIVTPLEQRARLVFAMSQELSKTVSMIDGVTRARVHLVLPEIELRGANSTKPSASVAIHHRAGMDTADLSGKVRTLVANGVQGLSVRDVTVATFVQDSRAYPLGTGEAAAAAASPLPLPSAGLSTILWMVAGLAALVAVLSLLRGGKGRQT